MRANRFEIYDGARALRASSTFPLSPRTAVGFIRTAKTEAIQGKIEKRSLLNAESMCIVKKTYLFEFGVVKVSWIEGIRAATARKLADANAVVIAGPGEHHWAHRSASPLSEQARQG
jgi:hypothetical protein